jgi:hypothetical protein
VYSCHSERSERSRWDPRLTTASSPFLLEGFKGIRSVDVRGGGASWGPGETANKTWNVIAFVPSFEGTCDPHSHRVGRSWGCMCFI